MRQKSAGDDITRAAETGRSGFMHFESTVDALLRVEDVVTGHCFGEFQTATFKQVQRWPVELKVLSGLTRRAVLQRIKMKRE